MTTSIKKTWLIASNVDKLTYDTMSNLEACMDLKMASVVRTCCWFTARNFITQTNKFPTNKDEEKFHKSLEQLKLCIEEKDKQIDHYYKNLQMTSGKQ